MKRFSLIACALAFGLAWSVGPVAAQDTTKDKAERAGDKAESKMERAKDKASDMMDKTKEKTSEAWDKTKDKARSTKEKVTGKIDDMQAKSARQDTMAAQRALREKGFDPGPIDGVKGPRTTAALQDFQKHQNLPVTGDLDQATAEKLNVKLSSERGDPNVTPPAASPVTTTTGKRQTP